MKKTILFLLCTLCFFVAVASIACTGGGTHEHYFTQEVATVKYLASDATCTQSATYYYSCKCGIKDTNTFEYGAPLGHDFSDWQIITQPTETEEGLKTRKCKRTGCDYSENKSIPVLSHTHKFTEQIATDEFLATKATCTKKATYYYSCVCGENGTQTFEYGDPLGHKFNAQIVTDEFLATKATCVKKATYYYACSLCEEKGTKTYEYGNLIAHTVSDWIIDSEATCTTNGSKHKECTVCYTVFETETIPAGHNFVSGVCTRCGEKLPTEGLEYSLNADRQSYSCTGLGTVTEMDIVIASVYNGLPVTSIGFMAFSNCSSLTSVTIPDGVVFISVDAFYSCSSLTSITIPDSVTLIDYRAFYNCSGLISITLPDSLLEIGDDAFYNCSSLTSITIPDSVTSIGSGAFADCSSLTSITIPDSVTSIGSRAFAYCRGLTSVTIPNSVALIGLGAFSGCSGLEKIVVSSENTKYHSSNNCLIETASKTLITGCKNSIIPTDGSVTLISERAFLECSGLTSITIPDSVTSIGDYAFVVCSGLTSITIPESVISIGIQAFLSCSSLTSITIPDSVTSIGSDAFFECNNLQYNIYNNAKYLGNENNPYVALISATAIASCNINQKTKVIAGSAFKDNTNLTSVTISDSVVYINERAFEGCRRLTSVVIGNNVISIGDSAFKANTSLTSITIPDSVMLVDESAFEDCSGLTSVVIGNNVISIGYCAFYYCSNLTSITIPDSVTSIGAGAFSYCPSYMSVTFKNANGWKVTNYGDTQTLQSSLLSDTYTAAHYLTSKYSGYTWERG